MEAADMPKGRIIGEVMLIAIAPKALAGAKDQAYRLRDNLSSILMYEVPPKSAFLNLWASCLGYKDWGSFNARTLNAHSNCANQTIITPDTIRPLATALHRALGIGDLEEEWLSVILFGVATREERDHLAGAGWAPDPLEISNVVELVLGPKCRYQIDLLTWLWPGKRLHRLSSIEEQYCRQMKNKRSGLSKKEVTERRLDVYPKSGVRVADIVNGLQEEGYLERAGGDEQAFKITERGHWWISSHLTDDWGLDWQNWFRSVQAHYPTDARLPFPADWSVLIKQFSRGVSPENAAGIYEWSPREKEFGQRLAMHVSSVTGIALEALPASRILAIEPCLLLEPYRGRTALGEIKLSISSPDIDTPTVKPRRYFPNPCHIGAGTSKEFRFFCVPVEEGVEKVEVVLRWEVDGKSCTHTIVYHIGNSDSGWFFSDSNLVNSDCHKPRSWLTPYWIRYEIDGSKLEERAHLPLDQEVVASLPRISSQMSQLEMSAQGVIMEEHLLLNGGSPNGSA